MGDLVFLFHEVQLRRHTLVVAKLGLPHSEEMFNGILHTFVYFAFMQDTFEALENRIHAYRCQFGKNLPALNHEIASDFDTIFSGVF